jgi:hypothetical protein
MNRVCTYGEAGNAIEVLAAGLRVSLGSLLGQGLDALSL